MASVLLRCANHADGGDEQPRAGLRGAVQRHGQARPHRHVHALRRTLKFFPKLGRARLPLGTRARESRDAQGSWGQGSGHRLGSLEVASGSWQRRADVGRESRGVTAHGKSELGGRSGRKSRGEKPGRKAGVAVGQEQSQTPGLLTSPRPQLPSPRSRPQVCPGWRRWLQRCFSSPAGTRSAGKFVSSSTKGMSGRSAGGRGEEE